MSMHAAVVRSFDHPPRYETYPHPPARRGRRGGRRRPGRGPAPTGPQRRRGAGTTPAPANCLWCPAPTEWAGADGGRIYFVVPDNVWGSMADRSVADLRLTVPLPEDVNVAKVAAAMNPAMSAWVALRRRVPLQPGQSVLVLGATGNAGAMAVQVAKRLGAAWVVGAGRNPERLAELPALGADEVVALAEDPGVTKERLAKAAAEVDVVIDYLWGEPASIAIMALLEARADRSRAMDWVQIGAMAAPLSSFRRWRYAPPTSGSRAMGRGRYPPRHMWRSCRLSSTRSMLAGSR